MDYVGKIKKYSPNVNIVGKKGRKRKSFLDSNEYILEVFLKVRYFSVKILFRDNRNCLKNIIVFLIRNFRASLADPTPYSFLIPVAGEESG